MHQDRVGVGLKTVRHTHTHLYTSCKVFNSTNSFCIQRTGSSAIESLGIRHRLWHSVGSKAPIAPGVVCLERANTKLPFGTLNTANLCTDTKIYFFLYIFHVCVCLRMPEGQQRIGGCYMNMLCQIRMLYLSYCSSHPSAVAVLTDHRLVLAK